MARGGGDGRGNHRRKNREDDDATTTEETTEEEVLDENDVDSDAAMSAAGSSDKNGGLSPVLGLFQMGNDVKADVAGSVDEDEIHLGNGGANRGGALQSSSSTRRRRLFPWQRGAAAVTESETTAESSVVSRARQELERAWWNNAWMEQIPLHEDDETVEELLLESELELEGVLRKHPLDVDLTATTTTTAEEDDDEEDGDIVIVVEEEPNDNALVAAAAVVETTVETLDDDDDEEAKKKRKKKKDKKKKKPRKNDSTQQTSGRQSHDHTSQNNKPNAEEEKESIDKKAESAATHEVQPGSARLRSKRDRQSANATTLEPLAEPNATIRSTNETEANLTTSTTRSLTTPYTSTGAWVLIDAVLTCGYSILASSSNSTWKPSRSLRPLRKRLAQWTGMHGVLSGKGWQRQMYMAADRADRLQAMRNEHERQALLEKRLAAVERAKERTGTTITQSPPPQKQKRLFGWGQKPRDANKKKNKKEHETTAKQGSSAPGQPYARHDHRHHPPPEDMPPPPPTEEQQERWRYERLKEIDALMEKKGLQMAELATEKDLLQNMLNPLFNYSTTYEALEDARRQQEQELLRRHYHTSGGDHHNNNQSTSLEEEQSLAHNYKPIVPSREFHFPSDDLVDEYLDMLFNTGRLVKMNHTDLWKAPNAYGSALEDDDSEDDASDYDDDEEWLTGTERTEPQPSRPRRRHKKRTSTAQQQQQQQMLYLNDVDRAGSRWLRNGLGEKIGLALEMVAYKAVCANVMGILAKSLGAMHGANVMGHADIFVRADQVPALPPLVVGAMVTSASSSSTRSSASGGAGDQSYASQAFLNAIQKNSESAHKKKKTKKRQAADSVQRHAVIETLLTQCQVACPLLKLFPLAWQRAFVGNLVSMITAVLADFLEGVEFHILGQRLNLVLKPITEADMMKRLDREERLGSAGDHESASRRSHQAFEAAVAATTADMATNLKFLDRWHERVLGGDSVRTQVAALIARVVLSLVDDILGQARMDLWSAQTGGPRLVAGLYYRPEPPPKPTPTSKHHGRSSSKSRHK